MGKIRKMRVLVVDNEIEFASILAERLRSRKIEAESVFSGEDTMPAVSRFQPDVIVLDLDMPSMTGLEVLSQVKSTDPSIEVILLTGHGSFDVGIKSMQLGAFDYIFKPVDLSSLIDRITDAYDRRKGR